MRRDVAKLGQARQERIGVDSSDRHRLATAWQERIAADWIG